jgi:ribonuclease HII
MIGIDEAGRGCWAGPLVVGAVRLHKPVTGLKDSKKLTAKSREYLAGIIYVFLPKSLLLLWLEL